MAKNREVARLTRRLQSQVKRAHYCARKIKRHEQKFRRRHREGEKHPRGFRKKFKMVSRMLLSEMDELQDDIEALKRAFDGE